MTSGQAAHGRTPRSISRDGLKQRNIYSSVKKKGPESRKQMRKGLWNKLAHFSPLPPIPSSLCGHLLLLGPLLQPPNGSTCLVLPPFIHSHLVAIAMFQKCKTSHFTVLLTTLQWLPITLRIKSQSL